MVRSTTATHVVENGSTWTLVVEGWMRATNLRVTNEDDVHERRAHPRVPRDEERKSQDERPEEWETRCPGSAEEILPDIRDGCTGLFRGQEQVRCMVAVRSKNRRIERWEAIKRTGSSLEKENHRHEERLLERLGRCPRKVHRERVR